MVENPVLSGSIRMEGMQEFSILDGQGNLTISQLSGFKLSLFFFVNSIANHISPHSNFQLPELPTC